jgi:hypothetical protein
MAPEVVSAWVAIIVTLGVSIVGWSKANTANRVASRATDAADRSAAAAEQSAEEARAANELTRDANERADRAERRATTRNDVRWDSRVEGTDWVIFNKGADDALDVVVIVRAGKASGYDRVEVGHVASMTSAVVMNIADLRAAKAASNRATVSSMQQSGIAYFPSSGIPLLQRILWTDLAGGSHTTEEESHGIG